MGQPDPERICTSIVERSNLSIRMSVRRFTRLTNAFSKKWENHWAAVALWFGFYNFSSPQVAEDHTRHGRRNYRAHLECTGTAGGRVTQSVRRTPYPAGN